MFDFDKLSEKAQSIIAFLQDCKANGTENVTAQDIAASLDMKVPSVNGTLTSLQKKGVISRSVAEGVDKKVITLLV